MSIGKNEVKDHYLKKLRKIIIKIRDMDILTNLETFDEKKERKKGKKFFQFQNLAITLLQHCVFLVHSYSLYYLLSQKAIYICWVL